MTSKNDSPLSRYIQVLEAVCRAKSGLTLTDISVELDLRAPTVHRLVGSLKGLDLLTNAANSKSYVVGRRLQELLHATLSMAEYSPIANSVLSGLVEELGETAHLAKLNGNIAESVLMVQPRGSGRAFVQPGRELPLHAAASGKAILAFQGEEFISRYLAQPLARYTENTRVSRKDLLQELERVRSQGFAVCDNELDPGVLSYGHPIRVRGGYVLYSIGVTGLADRLRPRPKAEIKKKLARAATQLSKEFGLEETP